MDVRNSAQPAFNNFRSLVDGLTVILNNGEGIGRERVSQEVVSQEIVNGEVHEEETNNEGDQDKNERTSEYPGYSMSKFAPAWKVYEEELHSKANGIARWFPEPLSDTKQVEIGDVVYQDREGEWHGLFNALNGEAIRERPMPENFKPLKIHSSLWSKRERVMGAGNTLASVGVTAKEASAEGLAADFGGVRFGLSTSRGRGAFLWVGDDAFRQHIQESNQVAQYIARNMDSWVHSTDVIMGEGTVTSDRILLIRGTTMTTSFGVAAVSSSQSSTMMSISGGQGGFSGKASYSQTRMQLPTIDSRWGPLDPSLGVEQCIFTNYWKYKKRPMFLPPKIVAGAGPHELPRGGPSPGEDTMDTSGGAEGGGGESMEETENDEKGKEREVVSDADLDDDDYVNDDPVSMLLDYILEKEEKAQCAVASDGDLTELLRGAEWPENIKEWLEYAQPDLAVVNGVGMVSQEKVIHRAHFGPPWVGQTVDAFQEGLHEGPGPTEDGVAGPSGIQHNDATTPAEPEINTTEEQPEDAVEQAREEDTMEVDGNAGGGPDATPYQPTQKIDPVDSTSILGRIILGDRTVELPHRQLTDPDETSESSSTTSLHISPKGDLLAVGFEDGTVRMWRTDGWQLVIRMLQILAGAVAVLKFSPDGRRLACAGGKGIVWDIEDAQDGDCHQVCELEGFSRERCDSVWDLDWAPDSKSLATGAADNKVRIYDAADGSIRRVHDDATTLVSHVKYSPDGKYLVSTFDKEACIYNAISGERLGHLDGHELNIWAIDISPDSTRIVTASEDHSYRVWQLEDAVKLVEVYEHTAPVWCVGFNNDGKEIMGGSYDKTISVCDSYLGTKRHKMNTGQSTVTCGTYSADGDFIVIGLSDGAINLFDPREGKLIGDLRGHEDHVKTVQFSPDVGYFVSSSDDGTVRVWSIRDILKVC